jgi:hypothetical protein
MKTIYENIEQIENKWLQQLFNFCKNQFSNTFLPSHNHWHHYRVWNFVKELLATTGTNKPSEYSNIQDLIIATFFHDIGMKVNKGINHGAASKDICQKYFHDNPHLKPDTLNEILKAIKYHDDKDYIDLYKQDEDHVSLLEILNVGDDLDAFGIPGIIRYAEIYLLRNIPVDDLGEKVLRNAKQRFLHFEKLFSAYPQLIEKHKERYNVLKSFYESSDNTYQKDILTDIQFNISNKQCILLTDLLDSNKPSTLHFKKEFEEKKYYQEY